MAARAAAAVARRSNRAPSRTPASRAPAPRPADAAHRAVVVGYGPVGRTLVRLLRENEIEPTVIELNLDTVRALRERGRRAVYGDATHRETLEAAGVPTAAQPDPHLGRHGQRRRGHPAGAELNPRVRVLARSAYLRGLDALHEAGADAVFSGEGEVALAFIEDILAGSAPRPSRSTASATARTRELFARRDSGAA